MTNQRTGEAQPHVGRPDIPGYGIPETEEGVLPWSRAVEQLERARHYWMATVRPEGRPHAVPTWGAWIDGVFYTEGGGRKMTNLRANPELVVHLESGEDVLILEGTAEELRRIDRALFDKIDEHYAAKYDYRPRDNLSDPDDVPYPDGGLFAMRPRTAFAWSGFPADATRYRFSDG